MIRRPPRSTLFPSPTLSRSRLNRAVAVGHADAAAALCADAAGRIVRSAVGQPYRQLGRDRPSPLGRSEEHTSELQSRQYLVCRLLLEKKKKTESYVTTRLSA